MERTSDFVKYIYEYLRSIFSVAGDNKLFLQMAWPGINLSPADFKSSVSNQYDAKMAEKTFSVLCNIAPTIDSMSFENSGFEISDLYELLISSAIPLGVTSENASTNPLYSLFNDAQFEYVNAARASLDEPFDSFYFCKATPSDWFTESSAQFWPSLSFKSMKPGQSEVSNDLINIYGRQVLDRPLLTIKPTDAVYPLQKIKELKTKNDFDLASRFKSKIRSNQANILRSPLKANSLASFKPNLGNNSSANLPVSDGLLRNFKNLNRSVAFEKIVMPNESFNNSIVSLDTSDIDLSNFTVKKKSGMHYKDYIIANQLLSNQLPTRNLSNQTTDVEISFKYCRVNIDRPWYKHALLNAPNWYISATPQGFYSSGKIESNAGIFPFITTSFIAIRDLIIRANWTEQDFNAVSQSLSFGPFDIRERSINQNTFEVKGLQIIAWLSKLNPILPPISAP